MHYYIIIDGHRSGPYKLQELREMGISKDTLVWYEGLHGWTKAGEILELIDIVRTNNESFSGTYSDNTVQNFSGSLQLTRRQGWRAILVPTLILAALLLMMAAVYFIRHPHSTFVHNN